MWPISRLIIAAVRANPALSTALAFEAGILLMRAIQKNAGRSPVGRSAKKIEATLLAHKPEGFERLTLAMPPKKRRSRPRRRATA